MKKSNDRSQQGSKASERAKPRAVMLIVGIAVVVGLIAIENREWLTLRPVSSSAVAVSYASDQEDAPRADQAATVADPDRSIR